jgi:hypothetical protein
VNFSRFLGNRKSQDEFYLNQSSCYTKTSVNPMFERAGLEIGCQIFIGTSVGYNSIVKKPYFNKEIGI